VTWDNPDISVELPSNPGVPVDSHALNPSTDYVVVARVWNGSTTAPVVDLPVQFSYLEFGIGTVRHDVGETTVDLPVKGAPGTPAFARMPWRTPAGAGHYCLQVELIWADDANPANNMGQHNTDVRPLNSPEARFALTVRNAGPRVRVLRLELDAYQLPSRLPCPEQGRPADQRRREALGRHRPEAWSLPEGWRIALEPARTRLAAGEEATVDVEVTAPDGFSGRQAVNVRALDGTELVGGVTVYIEGRA
jgi:hypothetical protein